MQPSLKRFSGSHVLKPRVFSFPDVEWESLAARVPPDVDVALLDSVSGPEDLSRFSFFAAQPFASVECREGRSRLQWPGGESEPLADSPLEALRSVFSRFRITEKSSAFPFSGGGIGWMSYEAGRWIERLPAAPPDPLGFPECWIGLFDSFLVRDHRREETSLVVCEWESESSRRGEGWLCRERERWAALAARAGKAAEGRATSVLRSDQSKAEYCEAVRKAKHYIWKGELYQVNLSQRFQATVEGPSHSFYRRLKKTNPAPYAAFLATRFGDVLCSSPERYLRIQGREVETRPIKGTRPRSGIEERDAAQRKELWESEKDRAELTMIIDLERNDLKRVCVPGSVEVPRLYGLESYQTVFHLVSTIRGTLRPEMDWLDCVRCSFPGGSITGAPKIRAMEIITELEKSARSVYTGTIGWIGFDGDADLNIAIRTMLRTGDRISFRVGGGIVADSDPEMEYEETLHKGRGLAAALGLEFS